MKKWLRSIKNHVYWCATSSTSGPEKVAKWTSLLNHIQNMHIHGNPEFPKCAHPHQVSRDPKKWFRPGMHPIFPLLYNVAKYRQSLLLVIIILHCLFLSFKGQCRFIKWKRSLNNKRVLKDVEKLSHHYQTSSLKAFHSVIRRFAPKNAVLPFIEMLCRYYILLHVICEPGAQTQS